MTKYAKKQPPSTETQEEALKIARGIQTPGQTKEQTKLIAQGIQKGIQQFKKQQKSRSRELDKKAKKVTEYQSQVDPPPKQQSIRYKQHWLPWSLLILTWLGIMIFVALFQYQA